MLCDSLSAMVTPSSSELIGLTEEEKDIYLRGYSSGVVDSMAFVGMVLAASTFLMVALLPALYMPVRNLLRPWALSKVAQETEVVKAVQRFSHPVLDFVMQACCLTCGVPFYITFLPLLFWAGELRLARHMTILCAICIYVGNVIKDVICSPRPNWSKGVRLVGKTKEDDTDLSNEDEYGMPSTHTVNTVATMGYLMVYDGFEHPLELKIAAAVWCCIIMYGRIYLGMHSPIDVLAGFLVAVACLFFYVPFSEYVDAWITSQCQVPLYQLAFSALLCHSYPKPLERTPSYNYAVYFAGVVLGVITGIWMNHDMHTAEAAVEVAMRRGGPTLSPAGLTFAAKRLVPGMVMVLVARAMAKPFVQRLLAFVANSSPKFIQAMDRQPAERLLVYAVVGWTVVDPCLRTFHYIGI